MSVRPHNKRLFYRIGYTAGFFSLLAFAARLLGRKGSARLARALAGLYSSTQPAIVTIVAKNLSLLAGRAAAPSEAARVFENFAITLADYLWLGSRSHAEGFSLADIECDLEHLRAACAEGRGAILATGHYSFFEYGGLILGQMGFPVSVITHAEPSPELTRWRACYRARWGAETIELGNDAFSSLRAVEAIERGRLTAMLVDRPNGGRSLPVDLPGGSISYSSAPALLSWMTGCAIVPVCTRRKESGRYAIRSGAPIRADRTRPRDEALLDCTRQVAAALHSEFVKDPLQWYHFVPLQPAEPDFPEKVIETSC